MLRLVRLWTFRVAGRYMQADLRIQGKIAAIGWIRIDRAWEERI
jgi:hypothetical protein